jgi:hypothetical protein
MEVSYDQLIDTGINALGYLIASGLAVLVYSLFQRKRAPQARSLTVATPAPDLSPATSRATRRAEFVDLKRSDTTAANGDLAGAVSRLSSGGVGRRDRAEIIRIAREMLEARTPQETIKRTLPISDGELALLQSNNN